MPIDKDQLDAALKRGQRVFKEDTEIWTAGEDIAAGEACTVYHGMIVKFTRELATKMKNEATKQEI